MGALEELVKSLVLEQATPDFAADDPYLSAATLANQLGTTVAKAGDDYGLGEKVVAAAITGLLGGGFQQASQDYQSEQKDLFRTALIKTYLGDESEIEGLEPSLFDVAEDRGKAISMFKVLEDQQAADAAAIDERKSDKELLGEITKIIAQDPRNRDRIIGSLPPELQKKFGASSTQPIATTPKDTTVQPRRKESYEDILERTGDEAFARQEVQAQTERQAKDREELAGLESELNIAETSLRDMKNAVAGAGDTGSAMIPGTDTIRSMKLGALAALGNDEAQKRVGARADLDSLAINFAGQVRKLFPGPTSEREFLKYIGAVPGTDKTKFANDALIERMERTVLAARQSNDFLNFALDQGYSLGEAKQLYSKMDKKLPLIIENKDGTVDLNPARLKLDLTPKFLTALEAGKATGSTAKTSATLSRDQLIAIAKTFPNTPEGQAQFEALFGDH